MKEIKMKWRATWIGATAFVLLCALSVASYAWLTLRKMSEGAFPFSAGRTDGIVLELAQVQNGGEEASRVYTVCENGKLGLDAPASSDGQSYQILLSEMNFGSIDNLAKYKAENILYLCLTIPKNAGTDLRLKLGYQVNSDGTFFSLYQNVYDASGETILHQEKVTDQTMLDGFAAVTTNADHPMSYLQYTYAFASVRYEANTLEQAQADGNLIFAEEETSFEQNIAAQTALSLTPSSDLMTRNTEDANYYLYIKVTPSLTAFAYSIEYLATIMPCFVYFCVGLELEVMQEVVQA